MGILLNSPKILIQWRKMGNPNKIFVLVLSLGVLVSPGQPLFGQIVDKPVVGVPVKLEALNPKLDTSTPEDGVIKKTLSGAISDTYNPEVLEIPSSGSAKAYEVGLKLFNEGDYRRALNAFNLALIRSYEFRAGDPRMKNAEAAVKATEARMGLASELGYKTDNPNKNALTGKVEKVFQPSLAWLSGLRAEDRITKVRVENDVYHLTVVRKGKTYQIKLRLRKKAKLDFTKLAAGQAKKDGRKTDTVLESGLVKNPELVKKSEKLLGSYDFALLIDNSGSMASPADTGDSHNFLGSRWEWCRLNSVNFSLVTARYFPRGITLVPFNHQFAVAKNANRSDIDDVFRRLLPVGGTDIAKPLAYVLDDYFARRAKGGAKPIAVAVLTDGEDSFSRIRDVVIDATMKMKNPREIKITFLSVGSVTRGSPTLKALDDDLVDAGAAYDIVDTRYFPEILKYGLKDMVVASLIEAQAEGK